MKQEFQVIPRKVFVQDEAPHILIRRVYSMADCTVKRTPFSHNPGPRIMTALPISGMISFDTARVLIEVLFAEIDGKRHFVRFADVEESLSHQLSFPEDFIGSSIFTLGETFKGEKGDTCITYGHNEGSVKVLEHINVIDIPVYGSAKNIIPLVFEPVS